MLIQLLEYVVHAMHNFLLIMIFFSDVNDKHECHLNIKSQKIL